MKLYCIKLKPRKREKDIANRSVNKHSDFADLFLPRLYLQIGQTHTAFYMAQEAEPFHGAAIPAALQQVNWIRVLLAQGKSSQAAPLLGAAPDGRGLWCDVPG